ncbi:RING finger protein 121 [Hyalella azteca]|uniref:RING finger protein 121 n=1 Tax=Hyalella azteca TaxID=294128 RepID=A0A8B7NXD5_HYAAZ|nr:RING finger protein 121 [Hyalella azteca]
MMADPGINDHHDVKIYSLPGRKFNDIDNKLLRIIHENLTQEEAALAPDMRARLNHLRLHVQHEGHDSMHAEMVLVLFIVTLIAHVALVIWKKTHFKTYQQVSMVGVWLAPFIVCLNLQWWVFVFWWLVFTCITGLVMRSAMQRPLQPTTPRQVYKWFLAVHKLCTFLSVTGYALVMMTVMGLPALFRLSPITMFDYSLMFLFYGIYFGVLGRDLAEVCADKMAAHIGYYKPEGMPTRTLEHGICAICGNPQLVPEGEEGVIEDTLRLNCGHTFHEFCIRGWCIVGKKHTCPYCKEKVDMNRMVNYWEKPHVFFGQMVDWVRLMLAWQPLIIVLVQNINRWLDLK